MKNVRRSRKFCLHLRKLRLKGGRILCVAGPNGSGKSTFIECLAGVLTGPSINIRINGKQLSSNIRATKAAIGYVPDDENWFVEELNAKEYFNLLVTIYAELGIPSDKMHYRWQYLARSLNFNSLEQPLTSLSHGNKKKVQLIAGLLHQPQLIIVDELRNGLDPLAILAAETIVREEAARGACVVAATHDLWWAERIADETLLLTNGEVAVHDETRRLLTRYGSIENLFVQTVKQDSGHAAL
jgi:ABC-2 type transport system ATP-binding protein